MSIDSSKGELNTDRSIIQRSNLKGDTVSQAIPINPMTEVFIDFFVVQLNVIVNVS